MIGGLADWFAVEALFRHPLGLKIPHTALLPSNKDRVARQVGQFITTQFLAPDLVRKKLRDLNLSDLIVSWVGNPQNANLIAQRVGTFGKAGLSGIELSARPDVLTKKLRAMVLRPDFQDFLRSQISVLMGSDLRHALTDHALGGIAGLLDRNRDRVERIVQSRSRWWIASSADRTFSHVLVDQVVELMTEMKSPDSPLRADFDKMLDGFISDPSQSGQVAQTLQSVAVRIVESREFEEAAAIILSAVQRALEDDLGRADGEAVKVIQTTLVRAAQTVAEDADTKSQLNADILDAATMLLEQNTENLTQFITETILTWDETELVTLFEDQVGSDLQFIRINGTLLGGMIGGVLFGMAHLLPQLLG